MSTNSNAATTTRQPQIFHRVLLQDIPTHLNAAEFYLYWSSYLQTHVFIAPYDCACLGEVLLDCWLATETAARAETRQGAAGPAPTPPAHILPSRNLGFAFADFCRRQDAERAIEAATSQVPERQQPFCLPASSDPMCMTTVTPSLVLVGTGTYSGPLSLRLSAPPVPGTAAIAHSVTNRGEASASPMETTLLLTLEQDEASGTAHTLLPAIDASDLFRAVDDAVAAAAYGGMLHSLEVLTTPLPTERDVCPRSRMFLQAHMVTDAETAETIAATGYLTTHHRPHRRDASAQERTLHLRWRVSRRLLPSLQQLGVLSDDNVNFSRVSPNELLSWIADALKEGPTSDGSRACPGAYVDAYGNLLFLNDER